MSRKDWSCDSQKSKYYGWYVITAEMKTKIFIKSSPFYNGTKLSAKTRTKTSIVWNGTYYCDWFSTSVPINNPL